MAWQQQDSWNGSKDGNWSTFNLRVGTPPKNLSTFISTRHTWVSLPFAESPHCIKNQILDCSHYTGANHSLFYEPCESRTSQNLGDCANFLDGFDDGNPARHKHVLNETNVFTIVVAGNDRSWQDNLLPLPKPHDETATLGLLARYRRKDIRLTMYSVGSPSGDNVITSFIQGFPALSKSDESDRPLTAAYGYTAGAWYRNYPASLSIGSIVPSRIEGSAITIPFDFFKVYPDEDGFSTANRDILNFGLWSLSASGALNAPNGTLRSNYLDQGIWVDLDPQLPYLELPEEICHRIAHDFELDFDNSTSLFTVSESTRVRLRRLRPSFNITVGASLMRFDATFGPTSKLDVILPYEAFEHDMEFSSGEIVSYFPIRIAPLTRNSGRFVLGRVFFQEAYLAVDYHHACFNLSRAAFPEPFQGDIQTTVEFLDRPAVEFPPALNQDYLDERFQWIFKYLWMVLLPLLIVFALHVVLPLALSASKKWKLRQHMHQQETLWISLHVDYWPRSPSSAECQAAENRTSLFLLRCLTYVPNVLSKSLSGLRQSRHWPSRQTRYREIPGADDNSPLAELDEHQSQTRGAAEERQKWRAQTKKTLQWGSQNGKKLGRATYNFCENRVAPLVYRAAKFAFTWSNPLADFKEREARRRATRRRTAEGANAIDL